MNRPRPFNLCSGPDGSVTKLIAYAEAIKTASSVSTSDATLRD